MKVLYALISQKETLMTPPQLTGVTASVALRAPHRRVFFVGRYIELANPLEKAGVRLEKVLHTSLQHGIIALVRAKTLMACLSGYT